MTYFIGGLPHLPAADTPEWLGWFNQAQIILQDASNSGTTAQRPTNNQYVGKRYFDTSLGIPIWLKTPSATSPVWVNGAGVAV